MVVDRTGDGDSSTARRADDRLLAAWNQHIGADAAPLRALIAAHREAHRRYHTVEHVESVVDAVVELVSFEPVRDVDAVVAAAFFHDVIYDPTSSDNERASARRAVTELMRLGWTAARAQHVAAMIEATQHHREPPDHDHAVLFDADLSILAADPRRYADYVASVRAEYAHVDDDAWTIGRNAVLQGFLDRRSIYATADGRRRWEAAARTNIASELGSLNPRG